MERIINKLKEAHDNFPSFGFHPEFTRGFEKAFQMSVFIVEELSKAAPLATDNTLPLETISKSDGSGTIEIHPEVKKLAITWIENYTPNGSIMPEIAQKFKLAEDIQRIVDSKREQEREKVITECIDEVIQSCKDEVGDEYRYDWDALSKMITERLLK